MKTNELPHYDTSVNTTNCCAKFNPTGWDGAQLHFEDKQFVHATTKSIAHIPVNMGKVFSRVQQHMEQADAIDPDNYIALSRDPSAWKSEHLFASDKPVKGETMVTLSGDFITQVFEGPYSQVKDWQAEMQVISDAKNKTNPRVYFFYTTCPECAKTYGENYVVGVTEV